MDGLTLFFNNILVDLLWKNNVQRLHLSFLYWKTSDPYKSIVLLHINLIHILISSTDFVPVMTYMFSGTVQLMKTEVITVYIS